MLLVRIGKVSQSEAEQLDDMLRNGVPIVQYDPTWTCRVWTLNAIRLMQEHNLLVKFDVEKLESHCKEVAVKDLALGFRRTYEEIQKTPPPVHKFA